MNILTIGPSPDFPTDGMIALGIGNIFKHTFGEYRQKHTLLWDTKVNDESDFYPNERFDLIVQSGSPFLWDQMHVSKKWLNLKTCQRVHPNTKFVFLGIGSCLLLSQEMIDLSNDVVSFFKSSKVIIRDFKAREILKKHDIHNVLLPCPAFLSTYGMEPERSESAAAIWYDPRLGLSQVGWQDREQILKYVTEYKRFVVNENVKDIYYVNEIEHPGSVFQGDYNFIKLSHPRDVIAMINKHQKILSGRVHCAIPAVAAGRTVRLLAIDSRARTLYDFPHVDKISLLNSYRDCLLEKTSCS